MADASSVHGGDDGARSTDRRALVRGLAGVSLLAVTAGAEAILAACSTTSGERSTSASPGSGGEAPSTGARSGTTLPMAVPPEVYDPTRGYWMQGNFAPITEEVEVTTLEVSGAIPPSLSGLYVRNGSNPAVGASTHWFLGDGMLHGVRIEKGRATWYRNRYVQTAMLRKSAGLGAGPPGRDANQSNVSVFGHGGKLLTSGEVGFPFEIDPKDLSTVGVHDFAGRLTTYMTAHPKIDPVTGRLHFFGYGFVPPYLTYHVAERDGTLVRSEEIAVAGPTMIHDFAITDREAVFWEGPVLFDLDGAMKMMQGDTGAFPFRWKPSYGSRIGVLPFDRPGSAIRWVEMDPCYVFHGVNAYRSGEDVVLDVCRLPEVFSDMGDLTTSALHRWTVGTGGAALTFTDEKRSDVDMDLPGIDRRFTGRPHRHAWLALVDRDTPFPFQMGGIQHVDFASGAADTWDPKGAERAGEGVFVAGGTGEGEGWIITYSYDRARGKSDLVIFDALEMAKGPIARVQLPVRVPFGFHGTWVPDATAT